MPSSAVNNKNKLASPLIPTILITGAAKRVGAEISRALHQQGARVIVHCHHSRAEADTLASKLNTLRAESCAVVQGDLLDVEGLSGLVDEAHAAFGVLTGLVNNASAFYPTPVGAITLKHWDELLGTNLKAPLFLSQAMAPYLSQTQGAIVNIVDIHAERPLKDFLVYTAAKAGLAGLTRALAIELGPRIRVNGVSPGAILWPELGHPGDTYTPEERARILAQVPLGRVGECSDIAEAVCYFMLHAPYITGQILAVDGGRNNAL
jgi:pteridine reductase